MRHVTTEQQATEGYLRPTLGEVGVPHIVAPATVETRTVSRRHTWSMGRHGWIALNLAVGCAAAWQLALFGFGSIGYRYMESSKNILPRLHAGMPATELWSLAGKPVPCGQKTLNHKLYRTYAHKYSDGILWVSVKLDRFDFSDEMDVDDTGAIVDDWSFQSGL